MINYKEFFKENWFKIIIGVPVVFGIFGIIIKNLYLVKYGVFDYNPFQADIIYTGICFITIILLHFFIFTYDTEIFKPKLDIAYILKLSIRCIVLSDIMIYLLGNGFSDIELLKFKVNVENVKLLYRLTLICIFGLIFYGNQKERSNDKLIDNIIYIVIIVCLILLSSICFVLVLWKYPENKQIAYFTIFLCIVFIVYQFGRNSAHTNYDNEKYKGTFNFKKDGSATKLDIFFALFTILIGFFGIISFYSNYLFEYIPKQIGGGKPIDVEIQKNESNISGKIIHINDDGYYILSDNKVFVIKKDSDLIFLIK